MNNPLVSVIIPVYNTEKYLNKCVDSVINQSYGNLEIWLVDDGSKDNSPAICDEYAKKDERIKVIHKANGGLSDARNAALNQMTGEYVSFVDSDDWLSENFISTLLNASINNDSEISIGCVCVNSNRRNTYLTLEHPNTVLNHPNQLINYICSSDLKPMACNKLYRAELFTDIRFPFGRLHEDVYVSHALLGSSKRVSLVEGCYYYWRMQENSITHQHVSQKKLDDAYLGCKEMLQYYQKNYPQFEKIAVMKYINELLELLKLIYLDNNPSIFTTESSFYDTELREKIEYLKNLDGNDYQYKLDELLKAYLEDKSRFIKIIKKQNRIKLFKSFIKKLIRM